jgi:hypothetical protein
MTAYIHNGAKNKRSGSTMQKMGLRGRHRDFLEARRVLPGYPKSEPFSSMAEVRDYVSGDTIACLLCGKFYKNLGTHLRRTHDTDGDDYRMTYNIPIGIGLWGADLRERQSARVKADERNQARLIEMQGMAYGGAGTSGPRPKTDRKPQLCELVRRSAADHLPKCSQPKYHDFSWHLELVERVYDHRSVEPPQGVASWSAYKKRRRRDADLRAAHAEARARRPRYTTEGFERA